MCYAIETSLITKKFTSIKRFKGLKSQFTGLDLTLHEERIFGGLLSALNAEAARLLGFMPDSDLFLFNISLDLVKRIAGSEQPIRRNHSLPPTLIWRGRLGRPAISSPSPLWVQGRTGLLLKHSHFILS